MEQADFVTKPSADGDGYLDVPTTIAELVFPMPTPQLRDELEDYRIRWEQVHGPVDLTKLYTSRLPDSHEDFLFQHHPDRYFAGLPPFVQHFIRGKCELAAKSGHLDDMEDTYLQLFLSGKMQDHSTNRNR